MPDQSTGPASQQPPAPAGPTISIGEEFGTAKRNLPPAKMLLLAIAAVLIAVAIASFVKRVKPQAGGSLDNVIAVEIPGQKSSMAAFTFTLRNTSDTALYVRTLQAKINTASGETSADPVSAIDFDRYFQAFPPLKTGAQPAISPETKIQPGETVTRTIIAVFPVTLDAFNQRQSSSVIIQPYNQTVPVVLTK